MQYDWRVRAVLLLGSVLAAASCTTTQPGSLGKRTATVHIVAKATVAIFDCYELWTTDDNGNPFFTGTIECDPALDSTGHLLPPANRSVPWNYSATISIIHRGTTNEEIVTSLSGVIGSSVQPGDGIDNFVSLTDYDPAVLGAPFKAPEVMGSQIVSFLNGKEVSLGSPFWLTPNGFELGAANILTLTPTFDFEVNSGDTVIVRARKQTVALSPRFIPIVPPQDIKLSGTLTVGGSLVAATGTTSSSTSDGDGISFSFTVQ